MKTNYFDAMLRVPIRNLAVFMCLFTSYSTVLADSDSGNLFNANRTETIVHTLYPGVRPADSQAANFKVTAPIQSDGQAVPVVIENLPENSETLAILIEDEKYPLAAIAHILQPLRKYRTRVRMATSGRITVLVSAGGLLLKESVYVKITRGAYGMDAGPRRAVSGKPTNIETKLKVRNQGENSEIFVQLNHPMLRGIAPAGSDQISSLLFERNRTKIADVSLGPNIASNPMTSIVFQNAKNPDTKYRVSWKDNHGRAGRSESGSN